MNPFQKAQKIIDEAEVVSQQLYQKHITSFIDSFVQKHRRDRWKFLLLDKRKELEQVSHKLLSDLNVDLCTRIEVEPNYPKGFSRGIYYEFEEHAVSLQFKDAWFVGTGRGDAIYSVDPGAFAVLFYHEMERWLCRR